MHAVVSLVSAVLPCSARALSALQTSIDDLTEEKQTLQDQVRPPPEVPGDRYELLRLLDRRQLEVTRLTGESCVHVLYAYPTSDPPPALPPEEWSSMNKRLNEAVKAKYEEQVCLCVCAHHECVHSYEHLRLQLLVTRVLSHCVRLPLSQLKVDELNSKLSAQKVSTSSY